MGCLKPNIKIYAPIIKPNIGLICSMNDSFNGLLFNKQALLNNRVLIFI